MKVPGGRCSGTIFWLIDRFCVEYHSREVPCEVGSTKVRLIEVADQESCCTAISVPSRSAPSATFCTVAGRFAVAVNTCSRVSAHFTGQPSARDAAAASIPGAEVPALPPNAPPTYGFTACTADGSMPMTAAISIACRWLAWLPL